MKSRRRNVKRITRSVLPKSVVRDDLHIIQATVTATPGGGVITVARGDGIDIPDCRHLASYTPTIGDTVWALRFGSDLLVLGEQS